ncbi:MAG: hypothetical protein HFI34_03105 [Lachnospiraceae bacterium]|nr:hypothetical protein [Lachnospiraceae bacterium]
MISPVHTDKSVFGWGDILENKCIVFYESWQMECCGTPFSTGDSIKWLVYKTNHLNSSVDVGIIDYCYEAHSSEWSNLLVLSGKVGKIKVLYQKYIPSQNNPRLLVPVNGKMIEIDIAKGFDRKIDEMEASGYIVSISEYTIRQATESEVTFR